jgi:hypothetical protein
MPATRRTIARVMPAAVLLAVAAGPTPAVAAGPVAGATPVRDGATTVAPGGAAYRALRRSGVSIGALGGATRVGPRIVLPVAGGTAGRASELRHGAGDGFALRRGRRAVRMAGLRVRLAVSGSRVTGRIDGGRRLTLFTLGWRSLRIDADAGTARGTRAPWRLSVAAARALRRKLDVPRLRPGVFARSTVAVRLGAGAAVAPGAGVPSGSPGAAVSTEHALDWGLRESFRRYIVGGTIAASDGAAVTAAGTYRFPVTAVTAFDAAGALSASFGGTVYFEKHGRGDAALLRLWLRNPRVEAPAGATRGALYADMTSKSLSEGRIVEYPSVRLAEIDLTSGTRGFADGTVTWRGVRTTLTAEGVDAFAGFYVAGDALDPLDLVVRVP